MAAGATYEPIATTTLSSAASSITFSSIPATYTDLRLVLVGISTGSGQGSYLRFNSDSATNYSFTTLQGNGTTAASGRTTSFTSIELDIAGLSSTPKFYTADIFSYAGSTYKTVLAGTSEDNNGSGYSAVKVGLWRSTSAINTITLVNDAGGNYNTGTTATLYGIKAA